MMMMMMMMIVDLYSSLRRALLLQLPTVKPSQPTWSISDCKLLSFRFAISIYYYSAQKRILTLPTMESGKLSEQFVSWCML